MTMLGFWPPETKMQEAMLGARAVMVRKLEGWKDGEGFEGRVFGVAVYSGAVVDDGVDAEVGWSCCTATDV